jgi:phenol/toluene 2-monooxygenase (NADH) P3/A3
MDTRRAKKPLGLKQRYATLTQGLAWDTTYQTREDVLAMVQSEGIKIHDWEAFQDPFLTTVDAYWKQQGEKEKKLYAVIDAFAQNNGHLGVSDVRYINAVKVFGQAFTPVAYSLHRAFAKLGRQFGGDALRTACLMQSTDQLRHFQTQTHAIGLYNKFFNGLHNGPHWFDHAWYLTGPKSFAEDALSAGPFECLVGIGMAHQALLANVALPSFLSGAAHNGDLATVTVAFSAQSDAVRHAGFGVEAVRCILRQDPANLPIVQAWIDKWFWRSYRLMTWVAMMQDYMLPKRKMSWREVWTLVVEPNVDALFADLALVGIRKPAGWQAACDGKDHISHQAWNAFYGYGATTAFHTWVPGDEEMRWLDRKYPDSFGKYYRPRLAHYAERAAQGTRYYSQNLPMVCNTCQFPMIFTEPGEPRWIAYRECEHAGEAWHFCSDACQAIFDGEPQKYSQTRGAVDKALHAHTDVADGTAASATTALVAPCQFNANRDTMDVANSEDASNFAEWGAGQSPKEGQL